ncbi:MAG: ribosome silencing factor [Myxococcales bacterium]|nr:ribosome silencing factor [Myxococcales bacterium]
MSALDRLAKVALIVEAAQDRKVDDVVGLDVREISSFADTFIIATGTSDRHVRAVADSIEAALKAHGEPPLGIEGYDEGRWVLIDCGDTIVHIFQQEIRDHYDLERLWSDAPALELEAAAQSVGT